MAPSTAGTSTSTVYLQTCAGSPSTAEVRPFRVPGPGCRFMLFFLRLISSPVPPLFSSNEGPVQAVLQGGREHGVLPAQGQSDGRDPLRARHQRHLCPGPLQGMNLHKSAGQPQNSHASAPESVSQFNGFADTPSRLFTRAMHTDRSMLYKEAVLSHCLKAHGEADIEVPLLLHS